MFLFRKILTLGVTLMLARRVFIASVAIMCFGVAAYWFYLAGDGGGGGGSRRTTRSEPSLGIVEEAVPKRADAVATSDVAAPKAATSIQALQQEVVRIDGLPRVRRDIHYMQARDVSM
jgi:hypothetical protein